MNRGFWKNRVIQIKYKLKIEMKYILFIAMDLVAYPFLLLLFIAKTVIDKILSVR